MNSLFEQYKKDKQNGKFKESFCGRDTLEILMLQIHFYLEEICKSAKMLNILNRKDIPEGEELKKALQTSSIEICKALSDCIKTL